MAKQRRTDDDLPAELEYLREPALKLVGSDRQIVGCGQVDFGSLERAIDAQLRGLTTAQATARRAEHRRILGQWLASNEASDQSLVTALRFVTLLLDTGGATFGGDDDVDEV